MSAVECTLLLLVSVVGVLSLEQPLSTERKYHMFKDMYIQIIHYFIYSVILQFVKINKSCLSAHHHVLQSSRVTSSCIIELSCHIIMYYRALECTFCLNDETILPSFYWIPNITNSSIQLDVSIGPRNPFLNNKHLSRPDFGVTVTLFQVW